MALEAVVFSQDHSLTSYNSCRDQFNFYNFSGVGFGGSNSFNYDLIPNYCNPFESDYIHNESNNHSWENQQYVNNSGYSSPDPEQCNCPVEQYLSAEAEADEPEAPPPRAATEGGGGRRKRRRRSCKNKEEVEQQRMTHIVVERNRRKQMNEYLAVIRSLMPPSYVQRGDQASIVAGAINYVKELEQLLHSLEAHKRIKHPQHHRESHQEQPEKQPQPPGGGGGCGGNGNIVSIDALRGLLSFPSNTQNSNESNQQGSRCNSVSSMNSGSECGGEVQVTMVESHANVKIMAKKKPKQLLRLVAGFQGLRLSVLHLSVTNVVHPSFLLYSFSLKVEEGCQVNSVDDITAAANHILAHIQDEASGSL